MPTYEYVCKDCENHWEEVQKISEPPIEVCPKCGKSTAKRQISGGNFILKGGGWYADLYSSSPKKSGGSEGKSDTNGAASTSSSTSSSSEGASKSSDTKSTSSSSGSGSSSGSSSGGSGGTKT